MYVLIIKLDGIFETFKRSGSGLRGIHQLGQRMLNPCRRGRNPVNKIAEMVVDDDAVNLVVSV